MNDVSSVMSSDALTARPTRSVTERPEQSKQAPASDKDNTDKVEVSEVARYMSKLREVPPVRRQLVDAIREQIARGTYENPEMIDAAVESLIEDLSHFT